MASPIKVCIISGLFIHSTYAQATDHLYAKLDFGYSKTKKFNDYTEGEKDVIDQAKASPGLFLGPELGYRVNENIRLGVAMHCISNTFTKTYEEIVEEISDALAEEVGLVKRFYTDARIKIKTKAFFLSGYYDFNNFKNLTPYITAGVGVARNKSGDYIINQPGAPLTAVVPAGYKNSFAWFFGIGMQVLVNTLLSFDIGVKCVDYGKTATKNELYGNNVAYPPPGKVGTKLKGVVATIGVVYRF